MSTEFAFLVLRNLFFARRNLIEIKFQLSRLIFEIELSPALHDFVIMLAITFTIVSVYLLLDHYYGLFKENYFSPKRTLRDKEDEAWLVCTKILPLALALFGILFCLYLPLPHSLLL